MNRIQKTIQFLSGQIVIEPKLKHLQGKTLLHVTDTPKSIYPALSRLIRELKPDVIVHTGDLVDNIKLGLLPGSIHRYTRDVRQLIDLLERSEADSIYIAIGNHDDTAAIRQFARRSKIIETASVEIIEQIPIYISHYGTPGPSGVPLSGAQIALFGHNLDVSTLITPTQSLLNGLTHIHLIELDTLVVHFLEYPWGTDDHRLGKVRIRL